MFHAKNQSNEFKKYIKNTSDRNVSLMLNVNKKEKESIIW